MPVITLDLTPAQFILLQQIVTDALETNKRDLNDTKTLITISFALRKAIAEIQATIAIGKAQGL